MTGGPVEVEYLPGSQAEHAAALTAPGVVEYVPATHAVRTDRPVCCEYLPVAQVSQVAMPVLAWCLPVGHSVQNIAVLSGLLEPIAQSLHWHS